MTNLDLDAKAFANKYYPCEFWIADESALSAQRRFYRAKAAQLWMLVAVAAMHAVTLIPGAPGELSVAMSAVSAACLVIALLLEWMLGRDAETSWFDQRANAEAIKAETWRFMMRVGEYGSSDAEARFLRKLEQVDLGDADVTTAPHRQQITEAMRSVRGLDHRTSHPRDAYLRWRIADQEDYFDIKCKALSAAAHKWRTIYVLSLLIALVLSILVIIPQLSALTFIQPVVFNPVSFLVTVAGVVASWSQAKRLGQDRARYLRAGKQLRTARERLDTGGTTLEQTVIDVEAALLGEHAEWLKGRGSLAVA